MDPIDHFPPRPRALGPWARVESLRDWATDPRLRVAALLVAAAIAGFFWYQVGQQQSSGELPGGMATVRRTRSGTFRTPTTSTRPAVLVHVAGAVAHPGLVHVATGARVADAIAAAGGGLPDADLDRLNLAAKVVDGQRIPVARIGAPGTPLPDGGAGTGDPTTDPATTSSAEPTGAPINLNTATQSQLETLPGIGPSFATAIIRERERRGGFTSVEQLRGVRGIGDKRFAELKSKVSV